jgi:hypothetical protein
MFTFSFCITAFCLYNIIILYSKLTWWWWWTVYWCNFAWPTVRKNSWWSVMKAISLQTHWIRISLLLHISTVAKLSFCIRIRFSLCFISPITIHSTYKMTSHSFHYYFIHKGQRIYKHLLCGDQTEINVPETKSKKSYRVSLLYSVLQADWIDLLTFMVYVWGTQQCSGSGTKLQTGRSRVR